jgi:hypothetical protein
LAQRYLQDDIEKDDPAVGKIKAVPKRKPFNHQVSRRGLAASNIGQVRQVLNRTQLLQCADAYVNNGMVRTLIDKTVFFIQGERTGFVIEANEELSEGAADDELRKLEKSIIDDTLEFEGKPALIKDLRRKIIRINKRVKLHDRLDKLLTSTLIFGRNGLEIVRLPPGAEWPKFGEPIALRHLNSIRLVDVQVNKTSGNFEGFFYDEGTGSGFSETKRFIKSQNLISAFHDDNNLYDNTNYSGLSTIWPILSVSQADDVINDEDIPEITKNLSAGVGVYYPGTSSQSDIDESRDQLAQGTFMVTPHDNFRMEVHNLGRDPMELPNLRRMNAQYMAMCMSSPLFLTFEDTANFATANQVMQVYKAGMLKRYRTWLQGILEEYYDTILADHFNVELKDVISLPIKIKAVFPDINFEVRSDIITSDKILVDMGVFNAADVAKDIDRKDIVQRIEEEQAAEQAAIEKQRQQSIDIALQQRQQQGINQNGQQQPPNNFQNNQQQTQQTGTQGNQ